MPSYLDQLAQPATVNTAEANVAPPVLMGAAPPPPNLPVLRKSQWMNVLRAYGIPTTAYEQLPMNELLRKIEYLREGGAFDRAPIHKYYWRQALYNSDMIADAKIHNGFYQRKSPGRGAEFFPCEALQPWHGDPDGAPATAVAKSAKAKQPAAKAESPMMLLRQRAKELGLNSFSKSYAALSREIEETERIKAAAGTLPPAA